VEIPFAGATSDHVDAEKEPESVTYISPDIAGELVSSDEHTTVLMEDDTFDEKLFTPNEGIVEIPIGESKVNRE